MLQERLKALRAEMEREASRYTLCRLLIFTNQNM